ncbi:MAG: alpha-amylase family glycosyl hydrolase [Clostridium sp.]
MFKKSLYLIIILCFLFVGCSKNDNLQEKIEISILDGYIVTQVSIPENNKTALVTLSKDGSLINSKLFQYDIKDNSFENPKEIKISDDFSLIRAIVSLDGNKVYLSVAKKNDTNKFVNVDIVEGTIKDCSIENLTYINDINTEDQEIIQSIDSNNNLIYTITSNDGKSNLYYAKFNNGNYSSSKFSEEINNYTQYIPNASISPDGNNIIFSNQLDNNKLSCFNLQLASKKNENWFSKTIKGVINDGEEDKYICCISGDGKSIYYLSAKRRIDEYFINDSLKISDTTIYKISLDSVLKNNNNLVYPKEEENVSFPLNLRNKGNINNKEGIYYEIFVRSFADSNNDGLGDINGITNKLDYLKDLGIDGLWLTPIFSSPSYHGYDVISFYDINPDYGSEEDLKNLINEAHKRNMKIILDFPINHTSILNKWFTSFSFNPFGKYKNYYRHINMSDNPNYSLKDKSSWDSNVWHSLNNENYYYGIFSEDMADLNYNNKEVRKEIKKASAKWLNLGIDGFRLDASIHIYGDNEFKDIENQTKANIQWWNEFAINCEKINPNVYLVGEAWQETNLLEEYVQPFDSKFNFTFQENLINSLKNDTALANDNTLLSQIFEDTLNTYNKVDNNYIDGIFISNHDQNRIMSEVNNEDKAKLAVNIYMTLPGNPFIYYGEEIGMKGEKPDINIREAFKWTDSKKSDYAYTMDFSINDTTTPLSNQLDDNNSMYNHYKNIINLRKSNIALSKGNYESIDVNNSSIMAYKRSYENEDYYIFHNLSNSRIEFEFNDTISNGDIIFRSNLNSSLENNKVTLDKYSSIIIKTINY